MGLHRVVVDSSSGDVAIIEQVAYTNESGDVIILDADEQPPEGFTAQ